MREVFSARFVSSGRVRFLANLRLRKLPVRRLAHVAFTKAYLEEAEFLGVQFLSCLCLRPCLSLCLRANFLLRGNAICHA